MAIDVNCDLGEYIGKGRDMGWTEQLMKYISSCNVACGFHSGDPLTISETIELAKKYDVSIGAHPSYPDIVNFGRESMNLREDELRATLTYQISALYGMTKAMGTQLSHVKAHGALYHDLNRRAPYTKVFFEVINSIDSALSVFGPPNGIFQEEAKETGINFVPEAFADRTYTKLLRLVPRSKPDAVIIDPEEALAQVKAIIYERKVPCIDGKKRELEAQTICVHGDNPSSVMILQRIRALLNG